MKKGVVIAVILLLVFNSVRSQNYDQVLADLIQTKKWFEIDRYYQQYKDSLRTDFVRLWYKAAAGAVFNRFEESAEAYKHLIEKNYASWDTFALVGYFGQELLNNCKAAFEFKKGVEACNLLISAIIKDTTANISYKNEHIKRLKDIQNNFMNLDIKYPKMSVYKKAYNTEVKLKNSDFNFILVESAWNGIPLKAIFDTGASISYIRKRNIADKIGLKIYDKDTVATNSGKSLMGLVDSLDLGQVIVRNIPVLVEIDEIDRNNRTQLECDSILTDAFDIIIGLPVMQKLGMVVLDLKYMNIKFLQDENMISNSSRNMYIDSKGVLMLETVVFDERLLAFFDTGYFGGITLNSSFYTRYKDKIKIEKKGGITQRRGGCLTSNILVIDENWTCNRLNFKINNVLIDLSADNRVSTNSKFDDPVYLTDGGCLGNKIFKMVDMAIFNFNSMFFVVK